MFRPAVPIATLALVFFACHGAAPAVAPATPSVAPAASDEHPGPRVDSVAASCTKIVSCAHPHDAPRERDPSACVDWWVSSGSVDDAFASCVGAARDCAAVDACVRRRGEPAAAASCASRPKNDTHCENGRLVQCADDDPRESTSVDCGALQATCGEHTIEGGLVTRACLSQKLCPDGAPAARCDGAGAIVSCHDGAVDRVECGPGQRCEEQKGADGAATASCEPNGHSHCAEVGKRRCDGTRLVECAPHGPIGITRRVDCGAYGLTCDATSAHGCVTPGRAECDPAAPDGAPRCEGDTFVYCAAGKRVRVACADVGFDRCDPDAHGTEAACAARAAAPPQR